MVLESEIKFEIVLEGRIALERPGPDDHLCGVATLTTLDMAASELLANSDRWADDSASSRDLIDLAMLGLDAKTLRKALDKAGGAYGAAVERDLKKAIEALRKRRGRLADCMSALQMAQAPPGVASVPPAVLGKRIRALDTQRGPPSVARAPR